MSIQKKRTKSRNRYPIDLKRKIAKEYLSGRASYGILAEENGLRDKSVVKEFVKWYRHQLSKESELVIDESKLTNTSILTEQELAERVKKLEKQLQQAELKAEMLETMIDIAENELGIDIRKKSGANPSKK